MDHFHLSATGIFCCHFLFLWLHHVHIHEFSPHNIMLLLSSLALVPHTTHTPFVFHLVLLFLVTQNLLCAINS